MSCDGRCAELSVKVAMLEALCKEWEDRFAEAKAETVQALATAERRLTTITDHKLAFHRMRQLLETV